MNNFPTPPPSGPPSSDPQTYRGGVTPLSWTLSPPAPPPLDLPPGGGCLPEAVEEAIALNKKYVITDSEVEKACCEAWGVDFEAFQPQGNSPYIALYSPLKVP